MATASKQSSRKKSKQKQVTIPIDDKESLLYFKRRGNSYGGYGIHLLKEDLPPYLKSFVICYNCKGILRDACGVGDPQVSMCFVCTQGRDSIVLKPNREAVASLTVSCPLKSRGCGWEGKISESEPHLDVCGLFRLECKLSCGDVIERSDMSTHLDKNCPFREIQCEHCALIHKKNKTNIHQENCLEFPLKCPNGCGDVVQRKNLKKHTEQVCENTVIECPYKEYGCEVKVARREMEQHKSENRLIHLEIKTDSLCVENSYLKEQVSLNRSLLSFEGKSTFRISNPKNLGSDPEHIASFVIKNQKDSSILQYEINIFCSIEESELLEPSAEPSLNLIIHGKFISCEEKAELYSSALRRNPKLTLNGYIVAFNHFNKSLHSKFEYCVNVLCRARLDALPLTKLAAIPYEEILHPSVYMNDSILFHLFYNIERES